MSLSQSLQEDWYTSRSAWWALPIAALYGVAVALRRRLYRHGWMRTERLPVPLIVVGNITVGGTGKTPLVIALVEALRARGFSPGVASRGYGGSAQVPELLGSNPDPRVTGDEPALIKLRTGIPVAIGHARPKAARLLLESGVDVVIADDGLQHYALARDVEICVVDGTRRFGNGRLLPAGPLREPRSRLRDVDFVVCNGGDAGRNEVPMQLLLADAVGVADRSIRKPLIAFSGQRVHAVAGIGNPRRFFEALRERGIEVIGHAFSDHYRFVKADLDFDDEVPVLMTEKDAVKCVALARDDWWAIPVTAELPSTFFDDVAARAGIPIK